MHPAAAILAAALSASSFPLPPSSPPGVIIDTDLRSDADDAGTLALVNALADNGECRLLGVIANQTGPHIVAAIDAINTYYGRGDVPIGLSPVDDQRFRDPYAPTIGDPDRYPSTQSNATAPDSTTLYRRLLADAPDGSVVVLGIGGQVCLRLLLESEADHEGDGSIGRTGEDLVRSKVRLLAIMAGNFQDPGAQEHNINLDRPSAQAVAERWPTPILYCGFEIGRDILTGSGLSDPAGNPVAMADRLYPAAGGRGTIGSSASFDQATALAAIRGPEPLWRLSPPGRASFPDGRTRFDESPDGPHRTLLPAASPEEAASAIEALMVQPPRARRAQP